MYINGLKYACSTCIKGHRSSHCSHVDRPLFEIRKKGRPVTQCTFCRDLRKTKQVHIKCACTDKKGIDATNNNPLLIYRNNSSCSPKSLTSSSSPVANDIMTMDVCQDKKPTTNAAVNPDQCTCPSTNAAATTTTTITTTTTATATFTKNEPMIKSSSSNLGFNQYQQSSSSSSSNQQEVTHSLLAPLCPTVPSMKEEENLSYSWALITSPISNQMDMPTSTSNTTALISNATTTTAAMESNQLFTDMMMDTGDDLDTNNNNNNMHLGFIFHKPTSQRFLDGQPRVRRRRSNKQQQQQQQPLQQRPTTSTNANTSANRLPVNALIDSSNLTINTLTDYSLSTPPSSAVSPHPPSSSNSSLAAACEPMDMHFDYLTEQLEILSNNSNNNGNFMGDLANAEELTAILNNVFKEDELDSVSTNSHRSSISTIAPGAVASDLPMNSSNHATPTTTTPTTTMPTTVRSQCGSFVPRSTCCKPTASASNISNGESVVITITPLSTNNNTADKQQQQQNYPTTTRIVTCYCGNQCTCPGCLVHPGNFFLGNDPYAGPLIPSSNSSSCYGSDEEDLSATITASTFNNNNSNYNMSFS